MIGKDEEMKTPQESENEQENEKRGPEHEQGR